IPQTLHTAISLLYFFTAPPSTQISTLSLHDALPISVGPLHAQHIGLEVAAESKGYRRSGDDARLVQLAGAYLEPRADSERVVLADRKSTRQNSSHVEISYAVFCLKKKNKQIKIIHR